MPPMRTFVLGLLVAWAVAALAFGLGLAAPWESADPTPTPWEDWTGGPRRGTPVPVEIGVPTGAFMEGR